MSKEGENDSSQDGADDATELTSEAFDAVFTQSVSDDGDGDGDGDGGDGQGDGNSVDDGTGETGEAGETGDDGAGDGETGNDASEGGESDAGDGEGGTVSKKALLAEQRKRQKERDDNATLREKLAAADAKLEILTSQRANADGAEDDEGDSDFYSDPEKHLANMQKQIDDAKQTASHAELKALARLSAANMKREVDDYDEVMQSYGAVKDNPTVIEAITQSDDPAREAYKQTKTFLAQKDPDQYRESVATELLEDPKFVARMRKQLGLPEDSTDGNSPKKDPTNLAGERSIASGTQTDADENPVSNTDFENLFATPR